MKSARRQQRLDKKQVKSQNSKGILFKIMIPLIFVFFLFLFFKLSQQNWDGRNKVAFVFQKPTGDVGITVLDPVLGEESTLIIPGDTEVNVARNYGTLRIKNIWQLGINEKLGGDLLSQTITDSFLFPTTLWVQNEPRHAWKFIFSPKSTNIPFGDRVQISLFKLKVKSIDKTEIDLGKSQFLKKQALTDGTPGYVLNGPVSERLTVYFSDNVFSTQNEKFGIVDLTGKPGMSDKVGAILEVKGGKVVSLDKGAADANLDCEVYGQNKDAVKKIANLFSCIKSTQNSNLDMEIKIGVKFAKRF